MEAKLTRTGEPCPRCIGGQMGTEDYGDKYCLQCGYRQYSTEPLPYVWYNEVGPRSPRQAVPA